MLTPKQELFVGYVYLITNKTNEKKYVGITTRDVDIRLKEHTKSKSGIGQAIKKYGVENFKVEVLETTNNVEDLYGLEKKYVKKYNSYKGGYNQTIGGDGIILVDDLDIKLTLNQKRFLKKASKLYGQMLKEEDFSSFGIFKTAEMYLTVTKPKEKKEVSSMLLRLKHKSKIMDFAGITEEEVKYYSKQKLSNYKEFDIGWKMIPQKELII